MALVDQWAQTDLAALQAKGLVRSLETVSGPGPVLEGGLLNFSGNDYLGLANDAGLTARLKERLGATGAGASRLVTGHHAVHDALERALARFEGAEAALLFSSGWAANVGAVSALVGEGDEVFSDALNHASLIDGCRLSRAKVSVYRHCDVAQLGALLAASTARRKLVVTDAVFSMDGDCAPLRELAAVCARFEAALLVDEAHATGVLGPTGAGLCELLGVSVDVRVGTLSKALGGQGAWVSGSAALREVVLNRARSFVFSTGLSPVLCEVGLLALQTLQAEPERRTRLAQHRERVARGLSALGFDVRPSSAIFPVVLGDVTRALSVSAALRERGVLVKAIRPPTVPEGTSRLRIAVSAAHTSAQVETLLVQLKECL